MNKRGNSEEWTLAAACLYINAYSIGEDGRREGALGAALSGHAQRTDGGGAQD